jgi:hypothetical protein
MLGIDGKDETLKARIPIIISEALPLGELSEATVRDSISNQLLALGFESKEIDDMIAEAYELAARQPPADDD